jgi:hypothetical protein
MEKNLAPPRRPEPAGAGILKKDRMFDIKVRAATAEDIATIKGQLSECTSILVEVMSGTHGGLHELTALLERRTFALQAALEKAAAGEPLIFHDGTISFQHEHLMRTYEGSEAADLCLSRKADELQHR